MKRRAWLVFCTAVLVPAAHAQRPLVLDADGAAVWLSRFEPHAHAADAMNAQPGGWSLLVFVPAAPGWPMELLLRTQRRSGHSVRLLALDAAPLDGPGQIVPMPLLADVRAPGLRWSSRFALPVDSQANGVFVRVELWRADAASPPPLALQLRALGGRHERGGKPDARVEAPPSPMTQAIAQAQGLPPLTAQVAQPVPRYAPYPPGVVELPIWALRGHPEGRPPRLETPR
jgi:hypothetical protein